MKFLVESSFKQVPTPEMLGLIPAESAHGEMLDRQGVRLALYLAADQSRAWQIYQADSLAAVEQILASFPLHPYLQMSITLLANGPS